MTYYHRNGRAIDVQPRRRWPRRLLIAGAVVVAWAVFAAVAGYVHFEYADAQR